MNWKRYLQDKRVEILIFMVGVIIEAVFLAACQVETELFLVAVLVPLVAWLFCLLYDYYRKNSFYRRLFQNLDRMDQKYLVLETLESPRFYDGELLKEALYEANKSMTEHVNESRRVMREFKDFIEMWVHQVKLPVASLLLLCHNHPDENNKKIHGAASTHRPLYGAGTVLYQSGACGEGLSDPGVFSGRDHSSYCHEK